MANKEVIKQWVDALRNGNYKQDTGALYRKNTNGYCCLGVLCDIAVENKVIPKFHGEDPFLPRDVANWAGFEDSSPVVEHEDGLCEELVYLNDNHGLNFDELADMIESTYL